jgi:predicted AAA+ superfamily ATPase
MLYANIGYMYIKRDLEKVIKEHLFKDKVLVLYGARQTGKTTLIKHILADFDETEVRYIDCELISNNELLTVRDDKAIFSLVEGYKVVVFDEAQTVKGIGSLLKSLFDHMPQVQYIATGSSSFDLANEVSEPLTGRSLEFTLYPLGLTEVAEKEFDFTGELKKFLRFGGYPGIISLTENEKERSLNLLVTQYLYKNVLAVEGLKKPELVVSLLKLLAYQIGSEVSYRELATRLQTAPQTVQKYIHLLENNFVIFRLQAFANNKRREVVKTRKIYFTDLGLRNALVNDFSPVDKNGRIDGGALFENAMILERLKFLAHNGHFGYRQMFWRTATQQEIDYVEDFKGRLQAFEFKQNQFSKISGTRVFRELYPNITVQLVTPVEGHAFVTGK